MNPAKSYVKGKFPHQVVRNGNKWKENREIRLLAANNICELCGKTDAILAIAHLTSIDFTTYDEIWNKVIEEKLQKLMQDSQFLRFTEQLEKTIEYEYNNKIVKCCPHCKRMRYSKNSFYLKDKKAKKFQCNFRGCLEEFNTPGTRKRFKIPITKDLLSEKVHKTLIATIYKKYQFELLENYTAKVSKMVDRYVLMVDTAVLCKGCHLAYDEGKKICPECKKAFVYTNGDKCKKCEKI